MKLKPWLAALVALPFSTSCSLVFVNRPRPVDRRGAPSPSCSTSAAWPIVDLLWTGLYVLGAAYWGSMSDEDLNRQNVPRGAAVGAAMALGTVALTSSIVGFTRVSTCQEEQAHGSRVGASASQPIAAFAVPASPAAFAAPDAPFVTASP